MHVHDCNGKNIPLFRDTETMGCIIFTLEQKSSSNPNFAYRLTDKQALIAREVLKYLH